MGFQKAKTEYSIFIQAASRAAVVPLILSLDRRGCL